MTLAVEAPGLLCQLDPAGRPVIAGLAAKDGTPVLLSGPGRDAMHGFATWGCPVMVPWANRLWPEALPGAGEMRPVARNWPGEGLAIHGTVFDRPWEVEAAGPDEVRLASDVGDGLGGRLGRAALRVAAAEGRLLIELGFTSEVEGWLDAGLGLHPWFPGGARAFFEARARVEVDDRLLPVGETPAGAVALSLEEERDHCFADWTGEAVVEHPSWPASLRLCSDAPHLHAVASRAFDAICLEPVTHLPNAAHSDLARGTGPMRRLGPDETMTLRTTLAWG